MTVQQAHSPGPIPIDQIHQELAREWAEVSARIQETTGQPPLRATTLTLALIAPYGPEVNQAREMLHQLAAAVPSRAILVVANAPVEQLSAEIWAQCTFGTPGPSHCYDVIQVDTPESELDAIPNIIGVNRLPELPTFVLWAGSANFESDLFRRVSLAADRLIIDSERFDKPYEVLRDYAMFLGTTTTSTAGSDLAWSRLMTWRELMAQSFDSPATARLLPVISRIEISYEPRRESGAILLASWITSRLGCEPLSAERSGATSTLTACRSDTGHTITIMLDRVAGTGMGIRAVRLHASADSRQTRVSIRRQAVDRSVVRVETTGMPRQERIVQHPRPASEMVIGSELMKFHRDKVYEEALAHAAGFARLCIQVEEQT